MRTVDSGQERKLSDDWHSVQFSPAAGFLCFMEGDTLNIYNPYNFILKRISAVSSYFLSENGLVFFRKDHPETLMRWIGKAGFRPIADHVKQIFASRETPLTLIVQATAKGAQISLLDQDKIAVKRSFVVDTVQSGAYFASINTWLFFVKKGGADLLMHFEGNSLKARLQSFQLPKNLADRYKVAAPNQISADARRLLFSVEPTNLTPKIQEFNPAGVSIWGYRDPRMKYLYGARRDTVWTVLCQIDLRSGKTEQLTTRHERILNYQAKDLWLLKSRGQGDLQEDDWNVQAGWYISRLEDSSENLQFGLTSQVALSPSGRLILSFNQQSPGFELLDTYTRKLSKVTGNISTDWYSGARTMYNQADTYYSDARWTQKEDILFLRDRQDIWQINASGKGRPRCLTNHFGKKHNMQFSFIESGTVDMKKEILLFAKDLDGKTSGFYRVDPSEQKDPVRLYTANGSHQIISHEKGVWLVTNSRVDSGLRYLISRDLKLFKEVASSRPPSKYNWMYTEMHNYQDSTGTKMRGVLFKPQDFDEKKKYPAILSCYQRIDNILNEFPDPSRAPGNLNIPWMVSQGYLVFVPDIVNEYNHGGASSMSHIMGAFNYLRGLRYVNEKKIGISGHSYGGFETAYAITHTGVFAAAYAGSPITDMILNYTLAPGLYHHGQTAIGPLLWDDPGPYLENSPLFGAHKITTPLLLMGNAHDFLAPQPLGLYNAMRRLGKRCWMLQYEGMNHTISGKASLDHTLRLQQFFDHYLKDLEAPNWMLIPGSVSMQKNGGRQNLPPQLLTPKAQQHADSLAKRPIDICRFNQNPIKP